MTNTTALERGYRRILACYPRDFRQEKADEILGVLIASAAEGQQRVGLAESAALVRGALRMRLRPGPGHPPFTVFVAIRLMCLGAALALAEVGALLGASSNLSSLSTAIQRANPGHGQNLALAIGIDVAFLVAGAATWLWLAWAVGRRKDWARFASFALLALFTMPMIAALADGDAAAMPAVVALGGLIWAIGLTVVMLLFWPRSWPYYRTEPAVR